MTKVWKKIPRTTKICACGCGILVTGTKRKMYAKPYCKFKAYLERKKAPNWAPDSRFDRTKNPLGNIVSFPLGEANEDVSSTV